MVVACCYTTSSRGRPLQLDRTVERYGLINPTKSDPTLHFRLAHSGRTVAQTPEFKQMLDRAGRDFDVLVTEAHFSPR